MSRLAVVTGASSGIGAAAALRLARQGYPVVLAGRDEARLARLADRIAYGGGRARIVPTDLGRLGAAAALAAEAGPASLVVHAAGAGRWRPLLETPPEDARAMMAVPAFAALDLAQAFAPRMIARGTGRFVFVTSPGSWLVWPNAGAYLAARHALKAIASSLRAELRKTGVGVTLVALGEVESPYWDHNPGSRAHLPRALPILMAPLTVEQAAATVARACAEGGDVVFRPAIFRAVVAMDAIAPGLVARWMRRRPK
jgi:short-subunit dehydrogenase